MVSIEWYRVACIAYFSSKNTVNNYLFFDENCQPVSAINTFKHLMLHEKYWPWKQGLCIEKKFCSHHCHILYTCV